MPVPSGSATGLPQHLAARRMCLWASVGTRLMGQGQGLAFCDLRRNTQAEDDPGVGSNIGEHSHRWTCSSPVND